MSFRQIVTAARYVALGLALTAPQFAKAADSGPSLEDTITYINQHTDIKSHETSRIKVSSSSSRLCVVREYESKGGGTELQCAPLKDLSMKGLRSAYGGVSIDCSFDVGLNSDECFKDDDDWVGSSRHTTKSILFYECDQSTCLNAFRHLFELLGVASEPKADPFATPR